MENFRDRKFSFVLYPDCEAHVKALEYIKSHFDYAYILHDKDTEETGEIKKEHWHVLIKTSGQNAVWSNPLCAEIGIETNYVEKVRNFDRYLEYMIHFNDDNKYQYDSKEVKGPLAKRLIMLMNKDEKMEGEKVVEMIEWIENYQGRLNIIIMTKHFASIGMWDVYRRSQATFIKIMELHNLHVWQELDQPTREEQRQLLGEMPDSWRC